MSERTPPHNQEAEKAVLGSMLLDNQVIDSIEGIIRNSDFYIQAHKTIFDAIEKNYKTKAIDLITLCGILNDTGKLDACGGQAYIASLVDDIPYAGNIVHYAGMIKEVSLRRQLITRAYLISEIAYDTSVSINTSIENAQKSILAVNPILNSNIIKSARDVVKTTFSQIEIQSKNEGLLGLSTGLRDLDNITGGLHAGELTIIAGRPSMGKAQPLSAKIKTIDGWKLMGDVKIGDELAPAKNGKSFVMAIHPQGIKKIYEVKFSDGRTTECCGEHLWEVSHRQWEGKRVINVDNIIKLLKAKRNKKRLWVDTTEGEFGSNKELPIDPYVLGALLGDGNITTGRLSFSSDDEAIVNRIKGKLQDFELTRHAGRSYQIVIKGGRTRKGTQGVLKNGIRESLKKLNLYGLYSHEKFIPEEYLLSNKNNRIELLRGLLDTDGWVEKQGSLRFCSTSKELSDGVKELVNSLGGVCSVSPRTPKYTNKHGDQAAKLAYYLCIQHKDTSQFLTLERKTSRIPMFQRQTRLTIESISFLRNENAQCITVTNQNGLYITNDYIVTHNSCLAVNIAHEAGARGESSLINSIEMPNDSIMIRMLASEAKIEARQIRKGFIRPDEWPKLTAAAGEISQAKVYFDDSPMITPMELRMRARKAKKDFDIKLLVLDYMQIMSIDKSGKNREQEVSEISRTLKSIARELGIAVIGVSQLNRGVDARPNKRPLMSDLRESGALEQDADLILFIYRDEVYDKRDDNPDKGIAEISIGKQRHGPTATIKTVFSGKYQKFSDMVYDTNHRQSNLGYGG